MRSCLSLIPASARAHRREDRMTLLCIVIAVFLVTSVFSLADMGVRMESGRLMDKHGAEAVEAFLENPAMLNYYLLAAGLLVLVLAAGALMISGSMNSSVARRVRFFGLLRCLGMTRRQTRRYVRLEALHWCVTGVPIGAALGVAATWLLCAALRFLVGEEFASIELFGVSPIGIATGALTGVVTVLLAAGAPARRAAAVSPMAALSDTAEGASTGGKDIDLSSGKPETALGVSHALASRKGFLLMVGSFALSIVLFLSFSVLIELAGYMLPRSEAEPDLSISAADGENSVDSALIRELGGMDGVRRVFGQRCLLDIPAEINDEEERIDLVSYGDFELECLEENKQLVSASQLKNVLGDGGEVLAVGNGRLPVAIGDTVRVNGGELRIAGLLRYNIYSEDGSPDERITLISSDETFAELTGVSDYAVVLVQTQRDITAENIEALRLAAGEKGLWRDVRESHTDNTHTAFIFLVYAFLAIIALVTVLGIMNSISMGVSARVKQYGVMRALGMTDKQLVKMIAAEAATYAFWGCVTGCAVGLALSRWLYGALVTSHFSFAHWSFPIAPLGAILLFCLLAAAAAVLAPARYIRNMSVTETISSL